MDIHAESASDLVNILFKHKRFTFFPQLSQIVTDYPQLSQIAKIFASIPSSSTAERSFSTLRPFCKQNLLKNKKHYFYRDSISMQKYYS